MADETVGLKITADTADATKNVKSLRQQIQDATQDVVKMNEQFGSTSTEAANAAKKLAELKDQFADAKSLSDAFNPDRKFQAFSGALQSVTGGFSALTGAMALFGVESEDVQKTLLKVQAALAISEGVNSVLDGVQAFKNLGAVVQQSSLFIKANTVVTNLASGAMKLFGVSVDTTSTSFKFLKGAIAATGIGLLIVALGAAYEAFENFSGAAQRAADAQKEFNDNTLKQNQEELKVNLEAANRREALAVAKAKAEGASEDEITKIHNDAQEDRLSLLKKYSKETGELDEAAGRAVTNQENQIQIDQYNQQAAANEKKQQQNKAHNDALKKQNDDDAKAQIQQEQDKYEKMQAAAQAWMDWVKTGMEFRQAQAEAQKAQDDADQAARDAYYENAANADFNFTMGKIENEQAHADAVKRLEEEKTKVREASFNVASNLFGAASQLLGQQTAAGKIMAIAQTTIDTYQSATAAYKSMAGIPVIGPALGAAAAAVAVAAGVANIKRITAVKLPGVAGGGGGSIPSINTTPPLTPQPPQTVNTSLDNESINKMGQAGNKTYVLETDVTNNQQRIQMLNRAARIN